MFVVQDFALNHEPYSDFWGEVTVTNWDNVGKKDVQCAYHLLIALADYMGVHWAGWYDIFLVRALREVVV